MDFKERVVIVTGGARGIGRGTCAKFYELGAHVICADKDADVAEETCKSIQQRSSNSAGGVGSLTAIGFDAGKEEDCKLLVEKVIRKFGQVDVLVNNVGIQPRESNVPAHTLPTELWDALHDVNLKSYFLVAKHALPHMILSSNTAHSGEVHAHAHADEKRQRARGPQLGPNRGGVIVNISSIQGHQSMTHCPAYASTKGGIASLTRQLAVSYGRRGVRAVTVSPGTILTELVLNVQQIDDSALAYTQSNTPLPRLGRASDVANAVAFLASPLAAWVTGVDLVVDGGITAKGGWTPLVVEGAPAPMPLHAQKQRARL